MSRNLARDDCFYCGTTPLLDEPARPITPKEAGIYFDEFDGLRVANATCNGCGAKYLAWVDGSRTRHQYPLAARTDRTHMDLSFRSSFNDEPGPGDAPAPAVLEALERVRGYGVVQGMDYARRTIEKLTRKVAEEGINPDDL